MTPGAAAAICLGTCASLTGSDTQKVRQLPDLTGMKKEVIIQKVHRNGYDHAVRSTGVRIVDVESERALIDAIGDQTAMMYSSAARAATGDGKPQSRWSGAARSPAARASH